MTDDDSDDLRDLDLHAWDAPAAPKGLADTVIARVVGADEAIAVTIHKRRRSRAIVVAACAGTVAAGVAGWLGARSMHVTADEFVVATEPQQLDIGGATVDVEAGTVIRAHRAGGELHVVQAGVATWHVPADEHLVIDAGSSASIDATGASLRVETKMNTKNALVMSGAALSAAAVALVGATVYEGQARMSDGPHVTVLSSDSDAASRAQLKRELVRLELALDDVEWLSPSERPDVTIAAGESATIHVRGSVGVELKSPCDLMAHMTRVPGGETTSVPGPVRLKAGKYTYEAYCYTGPSMTWRGTIDVVGSQEGEQLVKANKSSDILGTDEVTTNIDGTVVPGTVLSMNGEPIAVDSDDSFSIDLEDTTDHSIVLRAQHPTRGINFYVFQKGQGGAATVAKPAPKPRPLQSPPAPKCDKITCAAENYAGACCAKLGTPQPKCDAEALVQAGTEATSVGDYKTALLEFAKAYGCKPEDHTRSLAYMAACNSQNVGAARYFWRKMSVEDQNRYLVMCARQGITRAALDAP
ncbi:MAG TPA: hypothetical protein VGG74_02780 [Kofleriaceae bacterium]|jgi:hypothetical protein